MNSFRFIERGIRAEVARQEGLLRAGEPVVQETLHFDPRTERLTSMRSKEEAHDYRYFPEPDLTPVTITPEMLERARAAMPELPAARQARFADELGLNPDTAKLLAWRTELGDYFEAALAEGDADAVPLANWTTNELVQRLGADVDPAGSNVRPAALAGLVTLVTEKKITAGAGKTVLDKLVAEGGDPTAIVETENLAAMGGAEELAPVVAAALEAQPDVAARIRGGDMKPIGAIIGAVMKETKGRADGKEVTRLVREQLGL
jgi:aspartyl-tRNA(Asn)/glutamyl-tRNA(Gln) amidotransferase subunit B